MNYKQELTDFLNKLHNENNQLWNSPNDFDPVLLKPLEEKLNSKIEIVENGLIEDGFYGTRVQSVVFCIVAVDTYFGCSYVYDSYGDSSWSYPLQMEEYEPKTITKYYPKK